MTSNDDVRQEQQAFRETHYYGTRETEIGVSVEVWCPNRDETKLILGTNYVDYCPVCGGDLND